MKPYIHKLDKDSHQYFLNQYLKDPLVKQTFQPGDKVIIGEDNTAYLESSWNELRNNNQIGCETKSFLPQDDIIDLTSSADKAIQKKKISTAKNEDLFLNSDLGDNDRGFLYGFWKLLVFLPIIVPFLFLHLLVEIDIGSPETYNLSWIWNYIILMVIAVPVSIHSFYKGKITSWGRLMIVFFLDGLILLPLSFIVDYILFACLYLVVEILLFSLAGNIILFIAGLALLIYFIRT